MARKKAEAEKKITVLSEEEQPYELPEGWLWTRLGDITSIVAGGTPSSKVKEYYNGDIAWITPADLSGYTEIYIKKGSRNISRLGLEKSSAKLLPKDTVLLTTRAPIGYVAIAENDISTNQGFKNFLPNSQYNPRYMYWYLRSSKALLESYASGTTFLELSASKAALVEIPLPPLSEQQRIVERIESLFAKLDKAKENVQSVLDGSDLRRSAILHKAFSGELTEKWRKENGVSFDSWQELTLNDIANYKKGPFGSSITKAMFVQKSENTYKVYEQGNAIRKTIDYGNYYITEEKYHELIGFAVQPNDIIISCAGTVGEVYKLPENCEMGVINQALMRVRLYDIICEQFFIYYFGEILKGDIRNKSKGTAIVNIPPFKVMKAMSITLPTVPEQKEIVRLLDSLLTKEATIKSTCEKTLATIDTMKQSILAKAFRGELGTHDLADLPVNEVIDNG